MERTPISLCGPVSRGMGQLCTQTKEQVMQPYDYLYKYLYTRMEKRLDMHLYKLLHTQLKERL